MSEPVLRGAVKRLLQLVALYGPGASTLRVRDMAGVFGVTVLQVVVLGMIVWGVGRALRVSRTTLAAST